MWKAFAGFCRGKARAALRSLQVRTLGRQLSPSGALRWGYGPDMRLALPRFARPFFIAARHLLHVAFVMKTVLRQGSLADSTVFLCQSVDRMDGNQHFPLLARALECPSPNDTKGIPGVLPLLCGAKYRLSSKYSKTIGLLPGTICELVDICFHPADQHASTPLTSV